MTMPGEPDTQAAEGDAGDRAGPSQSAAARQRGGGARGCAGHRLAEKIRADRIRSEAHHRAKVLLRVGQPHASITYGGITITARAHAGAREARPGTAGSRGQRRRRR